MTPHSIHILYEDPDIIVCAKPHGLATQSRSFSTPDLEKLLLNHIARHSDSSGKPYLAVIHRLDQPVAGVLVFAKTPLAARELNKQLQQSGFGKHYLALVCKTPSEVAGTLENYLLKDGRTNCSRVCDKTTAGAKLARLHYRTLNLSDDSVFSENAALSRMLTSSAASIFSGVSPATLLEVTLDTGRHHQIRVQLAHMGCPIMGDTKYNTHFSSSEERLPLCLCAYRLSFKHPRTKELLHFEYPPEDIFLV